MVTDLLDAPVSPERDPAPATGQPSAALATALPAGVVIIIALLALLFDPGYDTTPLISAHARGYYLASFLILGLAIAFEVVRRSLASPALPTAVAAWGLVVGASTLVFAGDDWLAFISVLVTLAAADGWAREEPAAGSPRLPVWVGWILALALLWLALFGFLEFHLRWLYGIPLSVIIGGLAYFRFTAAKEQVTVSHLPTAAVIALATAQLSIAVSFLNVSAATNATVVTLALAGVYLAGQADWKGRAQ